MAIRVALLISVAVAGLGAVRSSPPRFCGLARTVNGFDLVQARGIGCAAALTAIVRIERDERGAWACSRAMHAAYELDCRRGGQDLRVLERSPVPVVVRNRVATLANWSFRVRAHALEAHEGSLGWISLGPPPWCVPDAPREVLLALRLRSLTPDGGCFGPYR